MDELASSIAAAQALDRKRSMHAALHNAYANINTPCACTQEVLIQNCLLSCGRYVLFKANFSTLYNESSSSIHHLISAHCALSLSLLNPCRFRRLFCFAIESFLPLETFGELCFTSCPIVARRDGALCWPEDRVTREEVPQHQLVSVGHLFGLVARTLV